MYLDRVTMPTSTKSLLDNPEQKPISFLHYSHHRYSTYSSSLAKDDHHRPFSHAIKAQRHSDPYSIKWITQGPPRDPDTGVYIILIFSI